MEFLSRLSEICSPNLGTTDARWGLSDVTGGNTKFGSVGVWKDDSWSDEGDIRSTIRMSECRSIR